jgi:galactokinase
VVTEIRRVRDTVAALAVSDWAAVGRLFTESHASLRDDFEVSCPELDLAVSSTVELGALGARMTGGGFGGSAIALVPADDVDRIATEVSARFATAGFNAPQFLVAHASDGATQLS